ncbi:MAG TPA: DNA repair protein RecO [Bryobacteraceae bacterium]|jgi:DNA repair protein RecO (recombination protein O)
MPARVSETFVLRTYPFREADLIVSFFTRDQGKLRGVARRARKPKSPFGAGLERLSRVHMAYYERENRDLVNLSGCELIESPFALQSDYTRGVALDFFAETAEHLLPAHEPNEKFFRLLASAMDYLADTGSARRSDGPTEPSDFAAHALSQERPVVPADSQGATGGEAWTAILYVSLWAVRLTGIFPEMRVSHESAEIAEEMFVKPLKGLTPRPWTKSTAADLRRLLVRAMEQHVERRFLTIPLLEAL